MLQRRSVNCGYKSGAKTVCATGFCKKLYGVGMNGKFCWVDYFIGWWESDE